MNRARKEQVERLRLQEQCSEADAPLPLNRILHTRDLKKRRPAARSSQAPDAITHPLK